MYILPLRFKPSFTSSFSLHVITFANTLRLIFVSYISTLYNDRLPYLMTFYSIASLLQPCKALTLTSTTCLSSSSTLLPSTKVILYTSFTISATTTLLASVKQLKFDLKESKPLSSSIVYSRPAFVMLPIQTNVDEVCLLA